MKLKSILAIGLVAVMASSMMVGCKKEGGDSTASGNSSTPASSEAPAKKAKSGQLKDVFDKTITAVFGDEAPSFSPMEDAQALKEMTGIDAANPAIKEFLYQMPMINVQFQIFFGIEANEGKVAEAEKIAKDYQAKVLADKEAFPYVDAGLEKAKGAQVVTIDNYVFYICLANANTMDGEVSQETIDKEIQKAVDAVKASLVLE